MSNKNKEKAVGTEEEAKQVEAVDDQATKDNPFYNKFLGVEKVRTVIGDGVENGFSTITLKSNVTHVVPTIILQRIITDEKNEHGGSFSDLKMAAIAKDILGLLSKVYHLRFSEVDRLGQYLNTVVLNDYGAALTIKFGKHKTQLTLEDLDTILTDGSEELKKIKENVRNDDEAQETLRRQRQEYMARNPQG